MCMRMGQSDGYKRLTVQLAHAYLSSSLSVELRIIMVSYLHRYWVVGCKGAGGEGRV